MLIRVIVVFVHDVFYACFPDRVLADSRDGVKVFLHLYDSASDKLVVVVHAARTCHREEAAEWHENVFPVENHSVLHAEGVDDRGNGDEDEVSQC